jgi:cell wall-associated NlpC family hydrolase
MGSQPGQLDGGSASQPAGANGAAAPGGNAVETVVSRALSQHGTPYSWGGGGKSGPGRGDDGKVGFDCSSLMQYAFAGAGVDLPRTTYEQTGLGHAVSRSDIQPGDLIFSNFGEGGVPGPGHVQLAISPTHVVEAPHSNSNVQVSAVPAGHIVVKRILG